MHVVVAGRDDSLAAVDGRIESIERLDDAHALFAAPRSDEVRDAILALAGSGAPIQIQRSRATTRSPSGARPRRDGSTRAATA